MSLHQIVSGSMGERVGVALMEAFNELSKLPEFSREQAASTIVSTLNRQSIVLVDWLDDGRVKFETEKKE